MQPTEAAWLGAFLAALGTGDRQQVLVFSNKANLLPAENAGWRKVPAKSSGVPFLGRQLTIGRWYAAAKKLGASRVICWGSESFWPGGLPAWVFVRPGARPSAKKLAAAAGIFVVHQRFAETLVEAGLPRVVPIGGGPMLELQPNFDAFAFTDVATDGCPYFLYAGPVHDTAGCINLLKGFSRFKRRQKSSWKLVILPNGTEGVAPLRQSLANYKYREDVHLVTAEGFAQRADWYQGAHAFVQPMPIAGFGTGLVNALAAGLPVIATDDGASRFFAGNAGVYAPPDDPEGLGEQLMLVYKDEALHGRLAAAAANQAALLSWRGTAAAVWAALDAAGK